MSHSFYTAVIGAAIFLLVAAVVLTGRNFFARGLVVCLVRFRLCIIQRMAMAFAGVSGKIGGGRLYWRGRIAGLPGSELGALDQQRAGVDAEQFGGAKYRGWAEKYAFYRLAVGLPGDAKGAGYLRKAWEFFCKKLKKHSGLRSCVCAACKGRQLRQRLVDAFDDKRLEKSQRNLFAYR